MKKFTITKNEKDHILNGWHKNYAYGDCHILSTVLSNSLKLPISVLFDEETGHPIHSFCNIGDNTCFDAHGINNIEYIKKIYNNSSKDTYIKKFNSEEGVKFLSFWSNVDEFYYESALEEFKFLLDNNNDFKNHLIEININIDLIYNYYNNDIKIENNDINKKITSSRKKNRPNNF